MNASKQERLSWWFERFSLAVSVISVTLGMLVLPGSIFNAGMFKSTVPGLTAGELLQKILMAMGSFLSAIKLLRNCACNAPTV